MKNNLIKLFILSISLFLSTIIFGQDEKSFAKLEGKTVLSRLFDHPTFNSKQEALWKPNYLERINMPGSDDGFCHTVLDTTLYYTLEKEKHAVLIFATYEYQNGVKVSCHACAPTLSIATLSKENEGNWQIMQFEKDFIKMGAWGKKLGKLGLEKLGENFYCLKVQSAIDGNQGFERGITSFYSLNSFDQFNEVFSYVYYDSNTGAMEDGKGFTEETALKIHDTGNEYFGMELNTKRTDRKTTVNKKYKYSEDERRYIPVNF